MFDNGFFGSLFDFNGDGKLDAFERAADTAMFMSFIEEATKTTSSSSTADDIEEDNLFSDDLEAMTGYSRDELEFMDEDERAEILEDAGCDVDDFDF